jgi:hypothetical protein
VAVAAGTPEAGGAVGLVGVPGVVTGGETAPGRVSASVVDDAPCPEQGRPVSGFVPIVLSLLVLLPLVSLLLVVSPGAVVLGTIAGFVGDTGFSGEPGTVTGALGFTVDGGGTTG